MRQYYKSHFNFLQYDSLNILTRSTKVSVLLLFSIEALNLIIYIA